MATVLENMGIFYRVGTFDVNSKVSEKEADIVERSKPAIGAGGS